MKPISFLFRPIKTAIVCFFAILFATYSVLMPIRWVQAQTFLGFLESGYILITLLFLSLSVLSFWTIRRKGYTDYASVRLDVKSIRLMGFLRKSITLKTEDIVLIEVKREKKNATDYRYYMIFSDALIKPADMPAAMRSGKAIGIPYTKKRYDALKRLLPVPLSARLAQEYRVKVR